MARDTASRKWQLTINNPKEHNYEHSKINELLEKYQSLSYYCLCDEIGEEGTYHTHIFLYFNNAVMFSTLKKQFITAHFEMAKGTCQQNRDYILKEGKWAKDKKKETNLADTFDEYGALPIERQGQRNDIHDLYDMIKQGMSNYEILESNPTFLLQIEKIERARQILKEEEFKNEFRKLEVTYISGATDTGKSRAIMDKYGYANVYRVTDYEHPFDSYKGQEIIVFEEFRSSLKIQNMLNYLDGYPLELPCRYANKIACFTKVFLITNIALEDQYRNIHYEQEETWNAFLRRIHKVIVYKQNEIKEYNNVRDYLYRTEKITEKDNCPFFQKEQENVQAKLQF